MQSIDKELDYLNQMVLKMTDLVEKNMKIAQDFYLTKKSYLEINDDLVDKYERLVEETCLDIMIKERPFAKDLRRLTGILTLVEDLERIGDHAEDIYNFTKKLIVSKCSIDFDINELFETVIKMFYDSIKSFINKDEKLAQEVINRDDFVDNLYEKKLEELIKKWQNKDESSFAIYTTLVVKYLERIADHSVNIAEWVIYILKGFYKDKQILKKKKKWLI